MNKKIATVIVTCMMSVGVSAFVAPTWVLGAEPVAETTTPAVESPRQGILSMEEAAIIFLKKYSDSAIHSISLQADRGQFAYKVEGYSLEQTYKASVDILTGKISKENITFDKETNLAKKVFNIREVINPIDAQAKATDAVGAGAIAKGWELKASDSKVKYIVVVHKDKKSYKVTVNAKDGSIMSKSYPVVIEDED